MPDHTQPYVYRHVDVYLHHKIENDPFIPSRDNADQKNTAI